MPPLAQRLLRHWPLKLAALALSLILWVVVQAQQTTSQLVSVDLSVRTPPTLTVVGPTPHVRALISGPGRELIKLYALRLVIEVDVPPNASLPRHVLTVQPADVKIPTDAKVVIQDLEPRQIELALDRVARRMVPVALRGLVEAESGFAVAGRLRLEPPEVLVSGPRSLINAIDSIPTEHIEVRGVTSAFERRVPVDTSLQPQLDISPRAIVLTGRVRRT
jgi:YbbR domain-containing protein